MAALSDISKLSYKAQEVLRTLCSNYRSSMTVDAVFRCSVHYGAAKFEKEVTKTLAELKKKDFISGFSVSDRETDDDTELCYFTVSASMSLSVEDMAEVAINSQTVYKAD